MKYSQEESKPIPFLKDWWRIEDKNGSVVCEHGDFEKGETDKTMNSHVMQGKKWKVFENCLEEDP